MRERLLLIDQLMLYSRSDMYPFHMPGHKRNGGEFPNPYLLDITEIEGFDNLHHPEGILRKSMEWAASVYGADQTYYLINGSTGGILSAVMGAVKRGGTVLISRNCHKSVYHGIILGCMETEYAYPQWIDSFGIQGGILPEDVDKILTEHPETEAVMVVSPTYDGVVSDIRGIAKAVHKRGIPLIVDEAHGAHFPFGREAGFPESALSCGADIVIQSLHKTLPSFTQTAVLHRKGRLVGRERLELYLQMFQSSSPSYLLMAGMECCIDRMAECGRDGMEEFSRRVKRVRGALALMKHMRLAGKELCGKYGVWDVDESKLVVSVQNCMWINGQGNKISVDGAWLFRVLREEFHLEMEMCGADYIVAIVTLCDTDKGLQRIVDALLEIDGRLEDGGKDPDGKARSRGPGRMAGIRPVKKKNCSDAMEASYDELALSDCAGRVSAEFICLYPPGIPVVAPGELVTEEICALVSCYREMGLSVQGMADQEALKLRVVK